jgi:riboflavin kinase/FMN adenylyltransferase
VCYIEPGKKYKPSIIALGNFDGVHLGHRKLLECGLEKAKELNGRLCVLLFDPHPFKILYPDKKLNLLTTTLEKLRLFSDMGVEKVFLLQFTSEVAKTSPKDFTCRIIKDLGAVHVVVGFNYSFGAKGIGKPQDLEGLGKECGFGVSIIQAQKIDDMVISSSEIRRFLLNGEIASAKKIWDELQAFRQSCAWGQKRRTCTWFSYCEYISG